ncbi:hypothetical protein SERLA73DRAFT_130853, partial [Serpula lacrymans var. lacrymans S7.3]
KEKPWMDDLQQTLGAQNTLGAKSRDGRNIDTSGRGNGVSSLACIKEVKNLVLLSRREGFHDDDG